MDMKLLSLTAYQVGLVYAVVLFVITVAEREVKTRYGTVKGDIVFENVLAFRNIPYAKPPLGEFRFKAPVPLDDVNDEDEPVDQSRATPCTHVLHLLGTPENPANGQVMGSEDCLSLDVYVEGINSNSKPLLPVVVYFHGSDGPHFASGSKSYYSPYHLMKSNAGIIAVLPNYRLGAFGFLSTQDLSSPGNYGLLDQRMALKWVKDNIEYFGGDASKVTIAGHGAGGASVGLHILSKGSHDYFARAISGSGNALDPWVIVRGGNKNAMAFANNVSCTTSSSARLVECLREKPWEDLLRAQEDLSEDLYFGPVVDGAAEDPFLPYTPMELYKRGMQSNVSYMAGVTDNEASVEFYTKFEEAVKTQHLDKIILHLMEPYLRGTKNVEGVVKAAKYHYLRGKKISSYEEIAPEVINLMSDFLYRNGLDQTVKLHNGKQLDTWMYVFGYRGERSLGDVLGPKEHAGKYDVSHMGDVPYLFNISFANWDISRAAAAVMEIYKNHWKSFIIGDDRLWPKYTTNLATYADVKSGLVVALDYRKSDLEFWQLLVPDLQNVEEGDSSNNEKSQTSSASGASSSATWGLTGLAVLLTVLCVGLAAVVLVTRKRFKRKCTMPAPTPIPQRPVSDTSKV